MIISSFRSLAAGVRRCAKRGVTLTLALTCLAGFFVATGTAASALPCRPPNCDPQPTPPKPPLSPTYYSDAKPLALRPGQVQPVVAYGAEHVATTVHVRYLIQRSTGQATQAWIVSDYHIWNDYAFQGWHVTVSENVYNSSTLVAATNATIYGVTPKAFDPTHADITVEAQTPISVAIAQGLYNFQTVDTFSN